MLGKPCNAPSRWNPDKRRPEACDRLGSARNPGPMMVLSNYLPGRDRHRDPCYGHATYGRQRLVVWTVNWAFEEALLTSRPLFPIVPLRG